MSSAPVDCPRCGGGERDCDLCINGIVTPATKAIWEYALAAHPDLDLGLDETRIATIRDVDGLISGARRRLRR